jgi:hypothetical protein
VTPVCLTTSLYVALRARPTQLLVNVVSDA